MCLQWTHISEYPTASVTTCYVLSVGAINDDSSAEHSQILCPLKPLISGWSTHSFPNKQSGPEVPQLLFIRLLS